MKKALNYLLNLDFVISGVAFLLLLAVTFVGVIMRYVFNDPIIWQEEAQLVLIVWVVYFGLSGAMRERSHVAIEMLVDAFPRPIRRTIELLGQLVVVVVLGYTLVRGFAYLQQMAATNRYTNILKLPYKYVYAALPVGCILTILNQALVVLEDLGVHWRVAPKKEEEGDENAE